MSNFTINAMIPKFGITVTELKAMQPSATLRFPVGFALGAIELKNAAIGFITRSAPNPTGQDEHGVLEFALEKVLGARFPDQISEDGFERIAGPGGKGVITSYSQLRFGAFAELDVSTNIELGPIELIMLRVQARDDDSIMEPGPLWEHITELIVAAEFYGDDDPAQPAPPPPTIDFGTPSHRNR